VLLEKEGEGSLTRPLEKPNHHTGIPSTTMFPSPSHQQCQSISPDATPSQRLRPDKASDSALLFFLFVGCCRMLSPHNVLTLGPICVPLRCRPQRRPVRHEARTSDPLRGEASELTSVSEETNSILHHINGSGVGFVKQCASRFQLSEDCEGPRIDEERGLHRGVVKT
jgi:hypothetical protein